MSKNIMISRQFFFLLLRYFFTSKDAETEEQIKAHLKTKIDKMAEHENYSKRFQNSE